MISFAIVFHQILTSLLSADFVDSVANAVDHPASPFAAIGVKSYHFSARNIRRNIEGVEEVSLWESCTGNAT